MTRPKYRRVLLKLSGELLGGQKHSGLDFSAIKSLALGIQKLLTKNQLELAIVIGGGNLFRGRNLHDQAVDPAQLDYVGMLGTIMNSLALQHELAAIGIPTRVMSSLRVDQACEPFLRLRAIHHLERKFVVILAGGTGSPFFTTDSAAALKAAEINADVVLKATNVDGVYDKDPNQNSDAQKFTRLTFKEALARGLMVMDHTAYALCQNQNIPVIVFDARDFSNVEKIINGESIGTLITP